MRIRIQPRLMLATARAFVLLAVLPAAVFAQAEALSGHTPPPDPALRARIAGANATAGERTFERRCATCHDIARDGAHSKGPLLWNVVDRRAGTSSGFAYSDAMRRSGHSWTLEALDYYLADTRRAVPGRSMDFTGIPDANLRADLIAYLRTMGDAPR